MEKAPLSPSSTEFWESRAPVVFQSPRAPIDGSDLLSRAESDGLILFPTSGSEGAAKVVGLTRAALLASAEAVNSFLGVTAEDRWLRVLPIFHVGGFSLHARAWLSGTPVYAGDQKWQAERFVADCADRRITLTSLVPTQVHDLVAAKLRTPASVRAVIVGGGELRPALWQRGLELGWPLLTSYGLTEAASQVATLPPGHPNPAELRVLGHWDVRLSPSGCLCLKGDALFFCYFVRQDGKWISRRTGEWFETADRVRLFEREGGRWLHFLGRRDQVIKILGESVDLCLLEARLADLSTTRQIAGRARLVSIADDRRQHRLLLEHEAGVDGPALLRDFNEGLPPFARAQATRQTAKIKRSPLGKPVA